MAQYFYDGEINQAPMYRAILLGPSGEVARMIKVHSIDDESALVLAQSFVDGHAVELWDGVRFIKHFPSID